LAVPVRRGDRRAVLRFVLSREKNMLEQQ